jgi:hypothetical protein
MPVSSNPTRGTTDRRAVCGKTARTVLREGRSNSIDRPYPYPFLPSLLQCHPAVLPDDATPGPEKTNGTIPIEWEWLRSEYQMTV